VRSPPRAARRPAAWGCAARSGWPSSRSARRRRPRGRETRRRAAPARGRSGPLRTARRPRRRAPSPHA